jgi:AraC family transcriptional regulator
VNLSAQRLPAGLFPTAVTRSRGVSSFLLTETAYKPHQKLASHSHERAALVIVLDGSFTERYGTKTRSCESANVIFRPSDEVHSDRFHHTGGRCLTVEISPQWLEQARACSVVLDNRASLQCGYLRSSVAQVYREFLAADSVSALALEGNILEMIADFSRSFTRSSRATPSSRIRRAEELIRTRFTEHLTLEAIANTVQLHPVYLARQFRKHYHCTIGDYVRRERIRFACQQLANSRSTLADVALAAGFNDQSHFARVFKRLTGFTPSRYRRAHGVG